MTSASLSPGATDSAKPSGQRWWLHGVALLIIGMELCWIVPWFRLVIQINNVASPLVTAVVLGGVMLLAYLSAYILDAVRLVPSLRVAFLGGLFAICLVVSARSLLDAPAIQVVNRLVNLDPGAVLVVMASVWVWWRGVGLARESVRPVYIWRRFLLGVILFLVYSYITTRLVEAPTFTLPASAQTLWLFTLFLLLSLVAMVLARVAFVSLAYGARKNPFDRRWFATTTLAISLAVGLAVVSGSLLSGQYSILLDWSGQAFQWLLRGFLFLTALPALLLSLLLGPAISVLQRLIPTAQPTPLPTEPPPFAQGYPPPVVMRPPLVIPQWVPAVLFWGAVLVVFVLLFGMLRRRLVAATVDTTEEAEFLLERGDLRRMLRKALEDLVNSLASRFRPANRLLVAARIRQIYAQLMELCEDLNQPRPSARTPFEFLPGLKELFPGNIQDLEQITLAYVKVRYGELPESQVEMDALETAWERVSGEGRRLKSSASQGLKIGPDGGTAS